MPIEKIKTAGDQIESRCLKCKVVTNHIIVAMTGETIAKVQCNSCGGSHNYRPPVAEKKKTSSIMRRRDGALTVSNADKTKAERNATPRKKVVRGRVNFEALIKDQNLDSAIPYAMDVTLTEGNLIKHPTFGYGIVMETMAPNKAQISFQEHGAKILMCKLG
ncbi:MAG: hypothetical protein KKB30_12990 [Proteobacteria bacterium]|nr:hypothetical protein [Pseudomonadota bacterium]MBU1714885.1 hypothetical protein [Pseudomonadota bacterium]